MILNNYWARAIAYARDVYVIGRAHLTPRRDIRCSKPPSGSRLDVHAKHAPELLHDEQRPMRGCLIILRPSRHQLVVLPREEDDEARNQLKGRGESLIGRSNNTTLANLNEKRGSSGYTTWRQQLVVMVASAGVDFLVALHTQCEIVMATVYTEEQMLLDDSRGIPYLTMPQIRQELLMALIRGSLLVWGESLLLIEHCVHAGGYVRVEGEPYAQALTTLDKRWLDGGIATDVGEETRALYSSEWPRELTVGAYDGPLNRVVALAAKIGLSPLQDSEKGIQLRGGWWHVVTPPPVDSVDHAAAEEARVVTDG